MSGEIRAALIAAVSSIAGIILGGSFDIFGQRERNTGELALQELKLESELVLKVRDYNDDQERRGYLCFIVKTGIVKRVSLKVLKDNGLSCDGIEVPGPPTASEEGVADPNFYRNSDNNVVKRVGEANELLAILPALKVSNDKLEGTNVRLLDDIESAGTKVQKVTGLLFHSTCTSTLESALTGMQALKFRVHIIIDKNGSIVQMNRFSMSSSGVRKTAANPGGNDGWVHVELVDECINTEPPPALQIATAMQVARLLSKTYQFNTVTGHYDLDPMRKRDPGPLFPMQAIRNYAME